MKELDLPIQALVDSAVLPSYANPGDAGLDLVSVEDASIEPGKRSCVRCGIAMAIPDGYCALVLPRSGLAAKHGITVLNSPGLIDSGYRGEICVVLMNTDDVMPFEVRAGMRIAQLMLVEVPKVNLVETDRLDITSRGDSGFGSSGI